MMNKTVLLITVSCVSLYTGALSYADIHSYHTPPRLSGTADTKSHNLYTPHLVAAHLSSLEDFAELTLPENSAPSILSLPKNLGNYLFYPLPKDLGRGWGGFHNTPLIQLASVCFVTDTGDCSGNEFSNADSEDGHGAPGGPGDDFDLDNAERCRQEGYTQTSCPEDSDPVNFCPYDNTYFERCQANCPSNYVTCEPPYYGVGEACGDKYASCEKDTERACQELNPGYVDECGEGQQLSDNRCSYDSSYGICCDTCSGYPYTADSIPNGYVQDGEACMDCDGNQKVKVKPNPCDGFMDCGSMGPETGANTCLSGTATMYDNCKPCPNLGIYDSCPSPYTCSFEDCSNKYYPTGCKSGYVWNTNNKTCTCDTSVYKYACTGTDQKGSGQACDGKYKTCTCSNGKTWNGKECVCDSSYKYTCNGTNESPSGTSCDGKYKSCYCSGAYDWDGSSCSCSSSYRYTCTGTGYAGGYGTSCDNKYTSCNCSSGYYLENNICVKCENKGKYDTCPSKYYCEYEKCSGKYYPFDCKSPYSWDSATETCYCRDYFKYTCTGTGESPNPDSGACDGKYGSCICREPYEWKNEKCYSSNKCLQGTEMGYYFYSDRTRSKELNSNKTVIGVVICSYADGGGQAAALRSTTADWTEDYTQYRNLTDQNLLPNSTSNSHDMYDSCANTKKIVELGDENLFPAAWYTHTYSTTGTSAGEWCLPASEVMIAASYFKSEINAALKKAGGVGLAPGSGINGYDWCSDVRHFNTGDSTANPYYISSNHAKQSSISPLSPLAVRPVIEF